MTRRLISIVLLVVICFALSGCRYGKKEENSMRVQRITFLQGGTTRTIESKFYFEYTDEEVDKAEFENATEKIENIYNTAGTIGVDGTVKDYRSETFNDSISPEELKEFVGKTYYYCADDGYGYIYGYLKITYTALHISYVDVSIINDDTFEVSYFDENLKETITMKVKSDNYSIVYFNE